jgi:hypothetical protein
MLRHCKYDGRPLDFVTATSEWDETNRFTVIVGKNGTGKSRLLKAIVENFVDIKEFEWARPSLINTPRRRPEMHISCDIAPSEIIAISTSPFDRFPIQRGIEESENYQYLGLRGLGSNNLSLSFMSRTLWALLKAVLSDRARAITLQTVLGYLGYAGFIEARFVGALPRNRLDEMFEAEDPLEPLMHARSANSDRFLYNLRHMPPVEIRQCLRVIRNWYVSRNKPRLDLRIDATGVFDLGTPGGFDESLLPLFKLGFFQLKDVGLQKEGQDLLIRINDASSGEQCVVMALLGIASHIQDGALICIDEPEICLHPEWQERYIELLMTTFGQFRGCHFIIATHSPQIIAKLRDRNCFVLDLESGITTTASALNGRSADFQLARVFRAPGFKNEYLSRVIFDALRVIGSGKELQIDKAVEIMGLLPLKDGLSEDDPVRGLMEILEKSLNAMGRA